MNRTILTHGLWALAAVGTFAIGTQLGGSGDTETVLVETSRVGKFADGGLSALPGSNGAGDGKLLTSDANLGGAMVEVELSDARIAQLGETALKDANPLKRRAAFDELLKGMTAENALAIRDQVKQLGQNSAEFRDFSYAWGSIAGEEAVLYGKTSNETDMAVTLAGWAGADAAGALAWFDSLPEEDGLKNDQVKAGLVHGLTDTDPMAAARFVYDLAAMGSGKSEQLLSIVTGEVLRSSGAQEASRWSESLPEGKLRASAMDRVANRLVAEDPQTAAAWVERFADDPGSARVIEEVGDEWAERDPVAAVNWLETISSGDGKEQAMSSAFSEWVKRDPLAASERLVTMNDSPERDSAISGFARRLAREDPQSAIAWAGEISDPQARERALVRAGQEMIQRDATGAREWLQGSGLSAEAQKQVLSAQRRRR